MARSQLRRLDDYTANAQRNAAILNKGLSALTGLTPPYVPADRTSVYYKYRVRIDRDALGVDLPASELRDRLIRALRAEGVEALLWQIEPLPAYPAFRRDAYGPWFPALDNEPLRAVGPGGVSGRVASAGLLVHPRAPSPTRSSSRPASLMDAYVEAFAKVLSNLEAVLERPFEPLLFD